MPPTSACCWPPGRTDRQRADGSPSHGGLGIRFRTHGAIRWGGRLEFAALPGPGRDRGRALDRSPGGTSSTNPMIRPFGAVWERPGRIGDSHREPADGPGHGTGNGELEREERRVAPSLGDIRDVLEWQVAPRREGERRHHGQRHADLLNPWVRGCRMFVACTAWMSAIVSRPPSGALIPIGNAITGRAPPHPVRSRGFDIWMRRTRSTGETPCRGSCCRFGGIEVLEMETNGLGRESSPAVSFLLGSFESTLPQTGGSLSPDRDSSRSG